MGNHPRVMEWALVRVPAPWRRIGCDGVPNRRQFHNPSHLGSPRQEEHGSTPADPENAVLVPHVAEVKRLRSLARRKKHAPQAPPAPSPAPVTSLTAEAPETPKA